VCTKSQLGLLNLPQLPVLQPAVTAEQPVAVVMIPGDQPKEGIDGYGGKTLRKGRFSNESGKRHENVNTSR